jgi:hypothetical protein
MTVKENNTTDDKLSLKEFLMEIQAIMRFFSARLLVIIPVVVLGAAAGLAYAIFTPCEYQAKLSFSVIEKSPSAGGGLSVLAGQFGLNIASSGSGIFSANNVIELLQSRTLIERTLLSEVEIDGHRCRLIEYYRSVNQDADRKKNRSDISFPEGLNRDDFTREQDSLLFVITKEVTHKKLVVNKQKKDADIILVSFLNRDERFAKIFTERLISIVSEFYVQSKTGIVKLNLAIMEARADSTAREYEKALWRQATYSDRNMNPSRLITGVEQQKNLTTIHLTATAYAELVKNIEIMRLDLAQQTPFIQIIDTPVIPLETERIGKIFGFIIGAAVGALLIMSILFTIYCYRRIMRS